MNERKDVIGCMEIAIGMGLGMLFCLLITLCGCKPQQEIVGYQRDSIQVPVIITQERHTESIKVDIVRDTIHQRDSIYHYVKGDTTIIERWHYYTTNNNSVRIDTVHKVDSIQVPVETEKIREKVITKIEKVEKPLKWWQKIFIGIGGLALIVICLGVAWSIGKRKG